ncbi:MAG TPA: NAD-dependent epimerase/dehydratase family protein, partial [Aggregatilineales bacterium]|nr:NAD-dependent epimerase/dehydratase family protein [Aggregatilineales bacterium]
MPGNHIIFGAGPIGMALMHELASQGKSVHIVHRTGTAHAPPEVAVKAGDASNPEHTRRLCDGAAVVYNCTNPPYSQWTELFPALQAGVLEGAVASGAKYVAMENLYAYGKVNGKPITEDLPCQPHTRKGKIRHQMTQTLMEAHEKGLIRVTIARASDYFGPGGLQSAMGGRVFYPALAG